MKRHILYILLALFFATPVCAQHRVVSYKQGYAKNASGALNPTLWQGLIYAICPTLGNTGTGVIPNVANRGGAGGTFFGSTVNKWSISPDGYVIDLSGNADDGVSIDGLNSLIDTDKGSLVFYVELNTTAVDGGIIDIRGAGSHQISAAWMDTSGAVGLTYFGGTLHRIFSPTGTGIFGDGIYMFGMTWDTVAQEFIGYEKGIQIAAPTALTQAITNALNNANIGGASGLSLDGTVGNSFWYNRVLTPNEMLLFVDQSAPFRTRRVAIGRVPDAATRRIILISEVMNKLTGGMAEMYRNN